MTDINNSVLYNLLDKGLQTIIDSCVGFVTDLWKDEKLIRHYTDHGIEHSIRILKIIEQFPKITDTGFLSGEEAFVLLLSVILHDIGMQCDIRKNKAIKYTAVELYEVTFEQEYSEDELSISEQNELRKNHHILTAAWLIEAYKSDAKSSLGVALSSIHSDLLEEIADICRFHSKLDIDDCDDYFRYTRSRKKLLATIVRLGDELDISNNRINSSAIENFVIPNENVIFWCLHQNTTVNIYSQIIEIYFKLYPKDYDIYSNYLRYEYRKFVDKNKRLQFILFENGIQMMFNENMDCIKKSNVAKLLPREILDRYKPKVEPENDSSTYEQMLIKIKTFYSRQCTRNPHLKTVVGLNNIIDTKVVCDDGSEPTLTNLLHSISLSSSGNDSVYYLLGEAGTGKTYGLLNAWSNLVTTKNRSVVYIPLNMISFDSGNKAIQSYLERHIFKGESAKQWKDVWALENSETTLPLLLILDGFNEVSSVKQQQLSILKEIDEIAQLLNIRIFVASRKVDNLKYVMSVGSPNIRIRCIEPDEIKAYVDKVCKAERVSLTPKLLDLLKTPLMLALYCESSEYYNGSRHPAFPCVEYIIEEPSESTIIWNYLQCMVSKAFESKIIEPHDRFSYIVLIRYIMPYIGQHMQVNNLFNIPLFEHKKSDDKTFDDIFDEAVEAFKILYRLKKTEIVTLRRSCGVYSDWSISAEDLCRIALNDLGLFVKNEDCVVLFHQSIRDCLAAIYLINEIKFCEPNSFPPTWSTVKFSRNLAVVKHIVELDQKLLPGQEYANVNRLWESLRGVSLKERHNKILQEV